MLTGLRPHHVQVQNVVIGPFSGSPVYTIQSPPLSTIMNNTLQISDNLEAELWMQMQGVMSTGFSGTTRQK